MLNAYKNKKVLITGNTGFKGSWLTLTLKMFGAQVIGYADKKPFKKSIISTEWIKDNIIQYYKKIENLNSLKQAIKKEKPDIIFHLAAQPLVLESYKLPRKTFLTNIIGTVNLLESIKDINKNIPVLITTTDKVYKSEQKIFNELDDLAGIDPYSVSKVCKEHIAKCYSELGLKIITARAGNVIGGGDWSKNRLIPDIMKSYLKEKLILIRNPSFTRPWLYILDVIEGYIALGEKLLNIKNNNYFNFYNLSPNDEKSYSVLELTKIIQEKISISTTISKNKNPKKENKYLQLDSKKIKKELGWVAKTSLNEALENTTNWYLKVFEKDALEYTKQQILNHFKKNNLEFNRIEKKYA